MTFKKLLFGPAGFGEGYLPIPKNSKNPTADAVLAVKEVGLEALELEFVQSVYLKKSSEEKLNDIKKNVSKSEIVLSIHAPYFINLNAKEDYKLKNSHQYILDSLNVGQKIGARVVVFHTGFFLKDPPSLALPFVEKQLTSILDNFKGDVLLGPELVGKKTQIGSLEEIFKFYELFNKKVILPVIDFSHLHAREGGYFRDLRNLEKTFEFLKSYPDYLSKAHFHMSGINYSEKGERNHLTFKDPANDFPYRKILEGLKDLKVGGTVICESPEIVKDALLLKEIYEQL